MPPSPPHPDARPAAIVLAAGKGTRMGGDLPKVVHEVCGRPMVNWVVDACRDAGVTRCVVVVGYRGELVREALAEERERAGMTIAFVEQAEQLGTGHAALMAEPVLSGSTSAEDDTFVLNGDGPLIRCSTLASLLDRTGESRPTAPSPPPCSTTHGLRPGDPRRRGELRAIVEQKDATPEQLAVPGNQPQLPLLPHVRAVRRAPEGRLDNAQGEMYLTDVPDGDPGAGGKIAVVDAVPAEDVLGVNTPEQRAEVEAILSQRLEQEAQA